MISGSPMNADRRFRFGPFELAEREGELRKNGVRIRLQEQPFRVLVELVANAGKVVSREELQQKLWQVDTFVDFDVGLNTAVRKLRQALNDDADEPRYVETLAKRGYRFVAPVTDAAAAVPSEVRSTPSPDTSGDSKSATAHGIQHTQRRRYWVLAASCALALIIYGVIVAWRGSRTTPPVATEQRVTANPSEAPVVAAVVSPDGKFVAYADTTGVYIRHIDTGETRPLQLPEGFDAVPISWFPDGAHLLLGSEQALYGLGPPSTGGIPTLWKMSLLGGSPQKLIDNASGGAVSRDGSNIAFLRGGAGTSREIWVMGTDGSNLRRVVEAAPPDASVGSGSGTSGQPLMGVYLSAVGWSPDGGRLAYIRHFEGVPPGPSEDKHSLETVEVSGGMPKVLKMSRQLLPVVCWATDGRLLYGSRDDSASERMDYGIWSVLVSQKSGEPEGKEVELSKGVGRLGGLSVSANGKRLILWRVNTLPQVFLTEIDAQTRRFKTPRRLTLDDNPNIMTAWTPDSRAILFYSSRSGTFKLFRQAINQAVPEVLVEGRGIFQPRISPDGTQILYLAGYNGEDPSQPFSVMAVPLAGGPSREVLRMPFIASIQCTQNPSKFCLLENTERLFAFDPNEGKLEPFSPAEGTAFDNWSISPDGSLLALVYRGSKHKITFVTVRDNGRREVELKESLFRGMDWAADSKTIFVTASATNGSPVVLGVEPDGRQRMLLEGNRAMPYWWSIPSPDGRYWALRVPSGANNVWMVENF